MPSAALRLRPPRTSNVSAHVCSSSRYRISSRFWCSGRASVAVAVRRERRTVTPCSSVVGCAVCTFRARSGSRLSDRRYWPSSNSRFDLQVPPARRLPFGGSLYRSHLPTLCYKFMGNGWVLFGSHRRHSATSCGVYLASAVGPR